MTHRPKPRGSRKSAGRATPAKPLSEGAENGHGAGRPQTAGRIPGNGASNGSAADSRALAELAADAARSAPEVREKLVARYRKSLKDGRYAPDLEGVAERMIREGLLKDL